MSEQLELSTPAEIPEQRVRALAGVLAGFRWPDRGSFEKLKKKQQQAVLRVAREALSALAAEEE